MYTDSMPLGCKDGMPEEEVLASRSGVSVANQGEALKEGLIIFSVGNTYTIPRDFIVGRHRHMLILTLPFGSDTMRPPLVSGVVQRSEEDAASRVKVDAPGGYHGAGFIGARVY